MIIIASDEQYEAVLIVLTMIPDEYERNDDEHTISAVLNDALDVYEFGSDICEVV